MDRAEKEAIPMIRRLLAMLLALLCALGTAQAGGSASGGKDAHLVQQEGAYQPRYSVSTDLAALPGRAFEIVLYEDAGTQPLSASRNGGDMPAGVSLVPRVREGKRQLCLKGTVLAEGRYVFSLIVQETAEGQKTASALAILHVTLRITGDAPVVEAYMGDGQGMLRVAVDGVNFRRTPGGTRLGQYDEGERMVWCSTQRKGGYTWYRAWTEDFGYGYIRGDMVQVEPPMRIVYTVGKETRYPIFITPGVIDPLTPTLIMTEAPEEIGFDTEPLTTVVSGGDTWTLLCFCIGEEKAFWIKADLRDEYGNPLECLMMYLTPVWVQVPEYVNN